MRTTKKRKAAAAPGATQDELCSGLVADDRLSSLPDELIGRILSLLPTQQAVLMSQLSRRWRRVWAYVEALNLSVDDCVPPYTSFRAFARQALVRFPTPDIPSLSVATNSHIHVDNEEWFSQAMGRAVGTVRFTSLCELNMLEFPPCTRAESLAVSLRGTLLSLPESSLTFDRLTELSLSMVRLGGTRRLDELVSSSVCPRLRSLRLCCVRGEPVRRLALHTDALEVLHLNNVQDLTRLDVVAANLGYLSVRSCFRRLPGGGGGDGGVTTVLAPMIDKVCWYRSYPKKLHAHLTHARRLSGLKLPALGRRDQFDFPYTLQLLKTCFLADNLDLELVMPDEMTLLNWLGPEGTFEDLIGHVPQLPNARVLSLTIRWGFGGNMTPSLASFLSRAPNLTRLHIFADPYCFTVFEGQQVAPPRDDHRWGRVRTDDRLHHDCLREINVDGLKGTDLEEYRVIELLLGSVPPSLESMSLRFRDDAAAAIIDEVAAEITGRFPMARGSWARCPPTNVITWSKMQGTEMLLTEPRDVRRNS